MTCWVTMSRRLELAKYCAYGLLELSRIACTAAQQKAISHAGAPHEAPRRASRPAGPQAHALQASDCACGATACARAVLAAADPEVRDVVRGLGERQKRLLRLRAALWVLQ